MQPGPDARRDLQKGLQAHGIDSAQEEQLPILVGMGVLTGPSSGSRSLRRRVQGRGVPKAEGSIEEY